MENEVRKQAYSVDEFAHACGISRSSAWNAVWTGQIRHVRIGRRVLIPIAAVEEFLSGQAVTEKA